MNMRSVDATVTETINTGNAVCIFHLKTAQPFDFQAGQYIELAIGDFPARPYSLANAPAGRQGSDLEIHIKDSGKGGMSSHAVRNLKTGDKVRVTGPFGHCTLDRADQGKLLMIAGGMGIAPIKALIEEARRQNHPEEIILYWGMKTKAGFYLQDLFDNMAAQDPSVRFVPVSGRPVGEAVRDDFDDLSSYSIYMAGPPEMVQATLPFLLQKKALPEKIHTDHIVPPAPPRNGTGTAGQEDKTE